MAFYHRNGERKRIAHDFRRQEEEVVGSLCRLGNRPISPKSLLEQEKRIRREIANSNERRRMQSINAGFQALRSLLPHREGEKLSKAAILQSTADYIFQLEQEKARLLEQNCQLKRRMINSQSNQDSDGSCSDSPLPKRKKRDTGCIADSTDEGIGSSSPRSEAGADESTKRELIELRLQLEHERELRIILQEQCRSLESQLLGDDGTQEITNLAPLQYHSEPEDCGRPPTSALRIALENGLGSPQSHTSNQESPHELPLRESSPELSSAEVPEDLSGKNSSVLLPCVSELSISDAASIPGILISSGPLSTPQTPFTVETDIITQKVSYKASTSRQNLETIVEAIRHVEGDHMFRDDLSQSESTTVQWCDEENTLSSGKDQCEEQTVSSHTSSDSNFRHQIIRNAPITQSRPGVIVSNHS